MPKLRARTSSVRLPPVTAASTDGRRRRAERSREAIVDALFELVAEGDVSPSAQRVAARAGVGIRSVFRHFKEMDTLYAEMNARLLASLDALYVPPPYDGPLATRIRRLVQQRVRLYERIAPHKRSATVHRWRSRYLDDQHRAAAGLFRADLLAWLPELRHARPALVSACDAALSFEVWDRLRHDQQLSTPRATEVLETLAQALVAALPASARRGGTTPTRAAATR
jgi:AcrR family transcriptional regulator